MAKFNPKKDYCSMSPDSLFGVSIKRACYFHDEQYGNRVKVRETREQADEDLYQHIYEIFKKNKNPLVFGLLLPYFPRKLELVPIFKWSNKIIIPINKLLKKTHFKLKNPRAIEMISPILGWLVGRVYYRVTSIFASFAWVK